MYLQLEKTTFFFKISENPEECRFVEKIYFKTIFMDILLIKIFLTYSCNKVFN